MISAQRHHRKKRRQNSLDDTATPFRGFEPLTANFLYCPNQLFDVCLPNHSRGAIRLVCYVLRRTLGWLDHNGNPIEQDVCVSYRDLVTEAGISRGAIRKVIDEAIAGKFICCTRKGRKNGRGHTAQSAQFQLRWDAEGEDLKTPKMFQGFYAGEGHRSPIPNAFFDHVVPRESLATVKVVGTVLRHTVGYQNQFGGRRSEAALSYSFIQQFINLRGRKNLSRALRHATSVGYIRCVEPGCVSPSSAKRKPATYAVKWLEQAISSDNGSKKEPAELERFKKGTSNGSERKPAGRFKKGTKEKTVKNNSFKQQDMPAAVAAENMMSFLLLRDAGFDQEIAIELARSRSSEEI